MIVDYEAYAENFLHLPRFWNGAYEIETTGCGCCSTTDRMTRKEGIHLLRAMREVITKEIVILKEDKR